MLTLIPAFLHISRIEVPSNPFLAKSFVATFKILSFVFSEFIFTDSLFIQHQVDNIKQTFDLSRILTYIFLRKKKSGRRDSNSRHSAWKADALPTELLPLISA